MDTKPLKMNEMKIIQMCNASWVTENFGGKICLDLNFPPKFSVTQDALHICMIFISIIFNGLVSIENQTNWLENT